MSHLWLYELAWVIQGSVFAYFLSLNALYALVLILSVRWCRNYKKKSLAHPIDPEALPGLENLVPPVTVIVPAYNEEKVIVQNVRSLLSISYARIEVIVVNDGSADRTLDELTRSFSLHQALVRPSGSLRTRPLRGVCVSAVEPRLLVVDKENGGKSDALNTGINFSQAPYFLAIDADSLVEPEALRNALRAALEDRDHVVAVGGIVRGVNGSIVDAGRIRRAALAWNFWVIVQAVEYLRSFLAGRAGWSQINGLLVVPGAFGLFQKAACVLVGGYSTETVTEDLELILRLQRYSRQRRLGWRIVFAPDAVCWTEMPATGRVLGRQRARWQEGLWQTMSRHADMCFQPRYGVVGMLSVPHHIFHELGGPLVELGGLLVLPVFYFTGLLSWQALALYFALAFFLGTVFSLAAILIDQTHFPRLRFPRDALLLLALSLLENFGYRQLSMYWRLRAAWTYFFGRISWRVSSRTGFATRSEASS
jgi:cellulose synthase/poly-beta-1,6-N-acetylglucosamine synthase-like glycosyltransferase